MPRDEQADVYQFTSSDIHHSVKYAPLIAGSSYTPAGITGTRWQRLAFGKRQTLHSAVPVNPDQYTTAGEQGAALVNRYYKRQAPP